MVKLADPSTTYTGGNEKGGRISGGLVTDEFLASSTSVLQSNRGDKNIQKGAQQWFTPPPVSRFISGVIGAYTTTLDFTAGAGSLLEPYRPECRFGIEVDRDLTRPKDCGYHAITGDAQKVIPLIRATSLRFPAVVINPPFGLQWHDPAHEQKRAINSTLLSYLWAQELLLPLGNGAMICGTNRLNEEVLKLEDARAIYAIVDIEESMWPGRATELCSISFFVNATQLYDSWDPDDRQRFSVTIDGANHNLVRDIAHARSRAAYRTNSYYNLESDVKDSWNAIRNEYQDRKLREAGREGDRRYDLSLKGSRVGANPNAYAKLALAKIGTLSEIEQLDRQAITYFGLNTKSWQMVLDAESSGAISVDPALRAKAEEVIGSASVISTPLFAVQDHMRLGWLTDLDRIRCTKDDPEAGFVAGETYPLETGTAIDKEIVMKEWENREGQIEIRKYSVERKLLRVTISNKTGAAKILNESKEDVGYLIDHFDLPDPGDIAKSFPEAVGRMREVLLDIQADVRENFDRYQRELEGAYATQVFKYKQFQLDHLSRLLLKKRGPLAHEQGLGKTLQLMTLGEASTRLGADDAVLFVAPQDLLTQWQDEAKRFFGRELEVIGSPEKAERVRRHILNGGTGWYFTHYEALSLTGRKYQKLPEIPTDPKTRLQRRLIAYKSGKRGYLTQEERAFLGQKFTTTKHACPQCDKDVADGWNGEVCDTKQGGCGYVHRRIHKKAAYSRLAEAFRGGVVCVDELSEIRGDDSLRSKALRALNRGKKNRGAWRWGGTGTPVSNFVNDAFWGLWWTLGNATIAFPYDYSGKPKFESDFCVIQHMYGKEKDGEDHIKKRRTVLPQVTNVSQFWRLTQPSVSRCRKEQTGEPLVPRIFHPIQVPMGVAQKQAAQFWLKNFAHYFAWKYPNHDLVKEGIDLVDRFAACLGQLWRLEHAATMPAGDPATLEYPGATGQPWFENLSNYTPATLKVLEIAMEHVERGDKVLIGSDLVLMGKWFADRLAEKNVNAVHITEEGPDGKPQTKNPKKRAREIKSFRTGAAQVLCTGIGAMKLGHNLDIANTVIVHGLPYSHMVMDQFLARVHRLTSKRDVHVYVILPKESLAEQKWQLLKDKGGAADLAFDGELFAQQEEADDWSKILKQMKQRGIKVDGEEVLEADVMEAFENLPALSPAPGISTVLDFQGQKDARSAAKPPSSTSGSTAKKKGGIGLFDRLTLEIGDEVAAKRAEKAEKQAAQRNVQPEIEDEVMVLSLF